MNDVLGDLKYAFRALARNKVGSALMILTLGLGIGANTAIFSVIRGVLLKPLPYADSDRLVLIRQSAPLAGNSNAGVSIKEFFTYRAEAKSIESSVEYHQMSFDLLKRGDPNRVNTGVVSHNFFEVLGIRPILGRSFTEEDDKPGAPAVLLLSYTFCGCASRTGNRGSAGDLSPLRELGYSCVSHGFGFHSASRGCS